MESCLVYLTEVLVYHQRWLYTDGSASESCPRNKGRSSLGKESDGIRREVAGFRKKQWYASRGHGMRVEIEGRKGRYTWQKCCYTAGGCGTKFAASMLQRNAACLSAASISLQERCRRDAGEMQEISGCRRDAGEMQEISAADLHERCRRSLLQICMRDAGDLSDRRDAAVLRDLERTAASLLHREMQEISQIGEMQQF
jgi:hypothetical protein